ncbi:MAG: recombinase family protein [Acidimicrobiales bacterium]
MASKVSRRAFIYARISIDRVGESEAPDRQVDACRKYCEAHGIRVVGEYVERDRSAFAKATTRPQYETMLRDVEANRADVVVAWKIDRISRRVAELASLVDRFRDLGVALVCPGDGVDTSSNTGALVATLIGSIAQMESEANSQRRIAKNKADALRGKYVKGGFRAFGRNMDGSLVEHEAGAIRTVARRVIDGETLGSQARWLNENNLRTTTKLAWVGTSLGRMLREPHLRGVRVHNGEEYLGDFEPILDESTSLRLIQRLRSNPAPRKGRIHLLSGLATCDRCQGRMNLGQVAHPNDPEKPKFVRYQCIRYEREGNCGSVSASEASLDKLVVAKFFYQVRLLLLAGLLDYSYDDEADREVLEREIAEALDAQSDLATARFRQRVVSTEDYQRLWLELEAQIEAADARLNRLKVARDQPKRDFDWFGNDPERTWDAMSDVTKRDMLRSMIEKVEVGPAKHRGGNKFDPSRASITWLPHAVVPEWLTEGDDEIGPDLRSREAFMQSMEADGYQEVNGRWTKARLAGSDT